MIRLDKSGINVLCTNSIVFPCLFVFLTFFRPLKTSRRFQAWHNIQRYMQLYHLFFLMYTTCTSAHCRAVHLHEETPQWSSKNEGSDCIVYKACNRCNMQQMSATWRSKRKKYLECVSHLFSQGPPGPLVCQGTRQKRREEGKEEKRVWVGSVR